MSSNGLTVKQVVVNVAKSWVRFSDGDLTVVAKLLVIHLRKTWRWSGLVGIWLIWSDLVAVLLIWSHLVGVSVVAFVKMDVPDAADLVGCRFILK